VSKANAAALTGSFSAVRPDTAVKVLWYIIACDGAGDGWYEASYIPEFTAFTAYIDTEFNMTKATDKPGRMRIAIDTNSTSLDELEADVRFYRFKFQLRPDPQTMTGIAFATASGAKKMWQWGGPQSPDQP
jgi:hypothetical protein